MNMTTRGNENKLYAADPRVKAFLDIIARAEGTYDQPNKGYNTHYGFSQFTSYAAHPNKVITKGGLASSAAGRYQFLFKTWKAVAASNGLPDFSPASQDIGAVELLRQRGALPYILKNDPQTAITKSNREWASFPGSPYGQGTRSMATMLTWYNADLQKYGGTPSGITQNNQGGPAKGAVKLPGDLSEGTLTSWLPAILIIGFFFGIIYYNYKS